MDKHSYQHIEKKIGPQIQRIERNVDIQQQRMLDVFRQHKVSEYHLHASTGYGYDDMGREVLEKIFADRLGAQKALVRPHIISGTHAIAACLYGVLRPKDELIYLTGRPYDTLQKVIGTKRDGLGTLLDYGIHYKEIPLTEEHTIDWKVFEEALSPKTKMVAIQRSRGYAVHPSFSIAQIEEMVKKIRSFREDLVIFVDNCYGEFVELQEPGHVGVDLLAGSLIKNPGGGLAKSGGYVAGRAEWIERVAGRLSAPGIGLDGGATHGFLRDYFQGLFIAPHVVGEALKGAVFASLLAEEEGFTASPSFNDERTDIIQQISLGDPDLLIAFCQGIQSASPIDAHLTPVPAQMPGYTDQTIMAAGTFVQGASIELSADGPLRPPYTVYLQGGLTYSHTKIAVIRAFEALKKGGK